VPDLARHYTAFYAERASARVYPVEFVVRAYLGQYPRLQSDRSCYPGTRALDIGFGDGRNLPLLADLGMSVFGVEIAEEICAQTRDRMRQLGISVDLRVGRNRALPFEDRFFDHVLACHSCYYVDPETRFADNVREIARVMRPGARFVFSAPIGSSYIMQGSRDVGDGHREIMHDPYGMRAGVVMKKFDDEAEISEAVGEWFTDLRIGSCRNDFWGINEHVWIVVCHRRA
jgi:SAM-dependent methyltransferase